MEAIIALDPTKKIARQVGWLNKNAGLKGKLSYTDVVEPLSRLDVTDAMKVLKDLESGAEKIDNPTGYVHAAAARVAAETGRPMGGTVVQIGANQIGVGHIGAGHIGGGAAVGTMPLPAGLDPTGKIARQVGWLNRNLSLAEPVSFSDVVEPLSCLDVTAAMAILKEIESLAGAVPNPTQYVLEKCAQHGVVAGSFSNLVGGGLSGGVMMQTMVPLDPTGKIARHVGWLNKNANLKEQLNFNEVVEPLSMLDVSAAMQILKDLESQAANVKNPTGYVVAAASRKGAAAGGAPGMAFMPMQGALDPTGKIGRQVGWLNKNANLLEQLSFNEVVEPLSMLDVTTAMQILKDLEREAAKVKNPTGYVVAAATRAGATALPAAAGLMGYGARAPLDPTGKIGRQVGWLNKNANLAEPIVFNDVVEPLSAIDVTAAMKILKDVEEQASGIKNPTGYVHAAAARLRGTSGAGAGLARPPMTLGGTKRTWQEEAASPSAEDENSKQIAKHVGRINGTIPMIEKLSYSDVKQHLEACGLEAATKILKDLEASAGSIKSPTQYVIAAAKRARSGESIPPKRQRVA